MGMRRASILQRASSILSTPSAQLASARAASMLLGSVTDPHARKKALQVFLVYVDVNYLTG